jgi:hypothetical protein
MLLSNKAILPLLYGMFPESPYLLPASFSPLDGPHVRKPIQLRATRISPVRGDARVVQETARRLRRRAFVYQAVAPMKPHAAIPVYGTWVITASLRARAVREDSIITATQRFVPHHEDSLTRPTAATVVHHAAGRHEELDDASRSDYLHEARDPRGPGAARRSTAPARTRCRGPA